MDFLNIPVVLIILISCEASKCQDIYESDDVYIKQLPGNNVQLFPDKYNIWFEQEGKPVYYNLVRDNNVTHALNPSICKLSKYLPDQLITYENKQEFAFYHNGAPEDSPDRAGFVLHRSSPDTDADVYGQFRRDGSHFLVQHVADSRVRVTKRASESPRRTRRSLTPGSTRIVEVFVWSAPDVFRFHKQRLEVSKPATEDFMRVWERAMIRDADLIFRTITTIDIRLIYVGGGGNSDIREPWFNDNSNNKYMNANTALPDVTSYLRDLRSNGLVPQYDYALVLTRRDLSEDLSRRESYIIAKGLAMSLCDPQGSVGLAEVSSPRFMKAIAQSILFAFGLTYDNTDQYKVTSVDTTLDIPSANRRDRWLLSDTDQLDLQSIVNNGGDCLLTEEVGFDNLYEDFLATPTYGATYDFDEQCSILFGSGSQSCPPQLARVCYSNQTCVNPLTGQCDLELLYGDKTSCGSGADDLVCRYGDCVQLSSLSTSSSTSTSTSTSASTSASASTSTSTSTTTQAAAASSTSSSTSTTIPTTTAAGCTGNCVCERYPLGDVQITSQYIPCE